MLLYRFHSDIESTSDSFLRCTAIQLQSYRAGTHRGYPLDEPSVSAPHFQYVHLRLDILRCLLMLPLPRHIVPVELLELRIEPFVSCDLKRSIEPVARVKTPVDPNLPDSLQQRSHIDREVVSITLDDPFARDG